MTIDRVSSELPTMDRIHDGQTLFLDGVGHVQNYHGDYARTVFVGEPSAAARRGGAAVTLGWQAICEQLRPGLAFSEIAEIGQSRAAPGRGRRHRRFRPAQCRIDAFGRAGRETGGFYVKDELFLEKDMVLSVDCPVMETGIGGSVHIEDLVVITADGVEPIHAVGDHVLTV